ncbi:MAG: hypothetical protein CM15mP98_11870 [Paracoccaceae bacterium]|nr:MAG: hypothetical protein CM15mP98_11870 [Paracoccaceae bacterium]
METVNEVEWISIKPNTDVALMLALCYEIYKSGATDRKFIDKYTVGFKKFTKYLNGDTMGLLRTQSGHHKLLALAVTLFLTLSKKKKIQKNNDFSKLVTNSTISW